MIQPYYQDNLTTLYHGKQEDILPRLTITADMVLTDPPYGTTDLAWDVVPDLACMWQNLRRLSKPSTVTAVFCQQPFTTDLIISNRKSWRTEWIWKKTRPIGHVWAKRKPLRIHEHVQIFIDSFGESNYFPQMTQGEPYTVKQGKKAICIHYRGRKSIDRINLTGERYPISVIDFSNSNHGSNHETSKPIPLLEYLILTYTNVGDLILDPFIGSGSTAVAAAKVGRRCIGIEMREEALEVAVKRLSQKSLMSLDYIN